MASRTAILGAAVALVANILALHQAQAAPRPATCKGTKCDTTAPTVAITAPGSGTTVSGTVPVAGLASDNVGVAAVSLSVDGGPAQPVSGTGSWTWSWPTASLTNGSHTLTVRAVDAAGNASVSTRLVSVVNTTTPTPTPTVSTTPTPTPTPTATPTPTPTTATPTPTPTTATPMPTGPAPNTQGTWTSPEGVTIKVASAGPWTIARVHQLLTENARDLDKFGRDLIIEVQDHTPSQTTSAWNCWAGSCNSYAATMWLKGIDSTFSTQPDKTFAHEFGHAWFSYHRAIVHAESWDAYLANRWASANGSVTLATDGRTATSYTWNPGEIAAEDYRILFGSAAAAASAHLNSYIPGPQHQPGLREWFLTWAR